jgi:long-chain acyl-CoA synthetase
MKGYYRDPERTREAFTGDGWFKTGDLGCMDARGNLYIRGRLKALILGPAGENIYPEEIESLINASGYVDDALVYADEKGNLIALVYLNEKARTMLAAAGDIIQETGHSAMQGAEYLLQEIKNFTNKQLAAFSRIHRVEIQEEPFEKTATQKIKRFLYPKKK